MRKYLLTLHRWFGIIGGLWILVLGVSGLMLDHRDDWGWAWRTRVPDTLIPDHTVEVLKNRHVMLAQANPADARNWVVGGPTGVWQSFDDGDAWTAIEFDGLDVSPMVFAIVVDYQQGWDRIWLATDDGLWSLDPSESVAQRAGLEGRYLTALDNGSAPGSLVAVENRSTVLFWREEHPEVVEALQTDETEVTGLPEQVSWSRFLFDMHLGRSFMNRSWNMFMNDVGAIAMVLLVTGGVLAWWLKKRWRKGKGPAPETRRGILKVLYNFHAPTFGLIVIFPLLYLSVTGIIFDHRGEWMGPLVRNKIARDALPDVYDFGTLHKEISHVIAYPGNRSKLTIGTRLGVLTTETGGDSWQRETGKPVSPGFVWSLKRHGNTLFLGGLGGPSFSRDLDGTQWEMVPGLMGMPSDAAISDNVWYVISGPSMFIGDLESGVSTAPFKLPIQDHKPLMLLMFELHNGKIIGGWFKYVLDAMAVFLIYMTITGPILWWRRKWM